MSEAKSTYRQSFFTPIKIVETALMVGERSNSGPQVAQDHHIALGPDVIPNQAELSFEASFRGGHGSGGAFDEVVIKRKALTNVH